MDIVVTGEEPFRVLDRFEAGEYPAGEVEPVDARRERRRGPGGRRGRARGVRRAGRSGSRATSPEGDELAASDAYAIAARVELPVETKQRLLELRSEDERMRTLGAALDTLIDTLSRSREIAERAKMNGKVVFGEPRRTRRRRRGAGRRRR